MDESNSRAIEGLRRTEQVEFVFRRTYRGPLRAVVLDWAGTTVDYGSQAPVAVFREIFRKRGVEITVGQARQPMGIEKMEHIRSIARMEAVAELWQDVFHRPCGEDDVDAMYQDFIPLQRVCIVEHADVIPGTLEAVAEFRSRRLKVGSTTGYSKKLMEILLPEARRRGYDPDACVCSDEVPAGRPYPWMAYTNAMRLGTFPMEAMVKVGDTLPDIAEGLNAGMWTVGVVKSGNEIGLGEREIQLTDPIDLEARFAAACYRMSQAGAHFVVKTIANVPHVLDEIERRVRAGDRP